MNFGKFLINLITMIALPNPKVLLLLRSTGVFSLLHLKIVSHTIRAPSDEHLDAFRIWLVFHELLCSNVTSKSDHLLVYAVLFYW